MSMNFLDPASRDTMTRVWREQAEGLFDLASDPETWEAPTASGHWQVRDIVGHICDTTEAYFRSFDSARGKAEAWDPLGVRDMAKYVDDGALRMRETTQEQLLARLRANLERMQEIAADLTDDEWAGLMVTHKYMGPIPAAFYPLFQIVDYGIHSWDIRERAGLGHGLDGEVADLLVPLGFILWQGTFLGEPGLEPFTIGIRVSGRNGGDTRVDVTPDGLTYEPGPIDDLPATIEFDPASFVLTYYGRMNAGTNHGDTALCNRFRNLFHTI